MVKQLSLATFAVALICAGLADAGETIRLGGQSADTHRLDLKPTDSDKDVTEQACWFRGGYGGYRGYGYGGYGFGYGGYGGFGYTGFGYSSYYYGASYYSPFYSYYSPAYSYYAPPVYSYYYSPAYYSVPRYYYSSPIVTYGDIYPMARSQEKAESPQPKSFRYDGGPAKPAQKIPPARLEEPAPIPTLPANPSDPKLGPSPVDMKVSLPAPAAKSKYTYPAYGEERPPARDDKNILIRRVR